MVKETKYKKKTVDLEKKVVAENKHTNSSGEDRWDKR